MKTMAIRLEDDLHAQLSLVASLEGQTVTDIIRSAVEAYISERKAELSSKADQALAEIEREAAARRDAISALFGGTNPDPDQPQAPGDQPEPKGPRGRRGGATSS
ncbi:MAG: hypothetical protein JO337_12025 [Acidimicrobiales bacterium]|nr:hypothetical protein [Acidimicrobiales bacterium]